MKYTVIGMISGTSYDAIDAAVADFDLDGDEVRCYYCGQEFKAEVKKVASIETTQSPKAAIWGKKTAEASSTP